jgi:hypothetical protein
MEETREEQLKRKVFSRLEMLEEVFELVKGVSFHQDQLARDLSDGKLGGLGALIKVAGLYGVEVKIVGKCGETLTRESG